MSSASAFDSMLMQRIGTALLLLVLVGLSLWAASPWYFAVLALVFVSAAAWEWLRLQGWPQRSAVIAGSLFCVVCGLGLIDFATGGRQMFGWEWWALSAVLWIGLLTSSLRNGVESWGRWPLVLRSGVGVVALGAAWVAVVGLHGAGLLVLGTALATIWLSDIGAYFGGRRFGRRKLAPQISPGKSWEGVWAGVVCATVFAAGSAVAGLGLYAAVLASMGWFAVAALCLGLVTLGVAGDLFESLVKRHAGAKDSSSLLPGHGGVLDRLDALLPSMPYAMLFASLTTRV